MSISTLKQSEVLASNQVLTGSYVVTDEKAFKKVAGEDIANIFFSYTTGAGETGTSLSFKVEMSYDGVNWTQEQSSDFLNGVITHTPVEHRAGGGAGSTKYNFSYPVQLIAKQMRVQVKEEGSPGNPGTVEVNIVGGANVSLGGGISSGGGGGGTTSEINGNVAHDAIDSGNPVKTGYRAVDPTALPTGVAIADRTDAFGSTQGEALVYKSRLDAGEDQGNNVQVVAQSPLAVSDYAYSIDISAALEASTIVKASAGNVYRFHGKIDAAAANGIYYVQVLNSATVPSDGAVTRLDTLELVHTNGIATNFSIDYGFAGLHGTAGLVVVLSSTEFTKTITSGSDLMSLTVLYK